jgi:hypothetical protein
MLQSYERIIRDKVGLLNLTEELGNCSCVALPPASLQSWPTRHRCIPAQWPLPTSGQKNAGAASTPAVSLENQGSSSPAVSLDNAWPINRPYY